MPESSTLPGVLRHWDFTPSPVSRWQRRTNAQSLLRNMRRAPAWKDIKPVTPKPMWATYFLFSPDGDLHVRHRFTLSRLRDMGFSILVICSTRDASQIPQELHALCDALVWKGLDGYDFSAYKLALWQISLHSPHADVLVINDSVFGPFTDLRADLKAAPWDLAGFMGSDKITNHIQSYAFLVKNVDRKRMLQLSPVLFPFIAVSEREAVIQLQELRMARVAARSMRTGAFWFAQSALVDNPTIKRPLELVDAGFPFLKYMLLTKPRAFTKSPTSKDDILGRLEQLGHPIDAGMRTLALTD